MTAEDAAGNVSGASNEDTRHGCRRNTAGRPTALAATVAGSTVNLSWTAATDNVGVARYNVHRGDDLRLHAERGEPGRTADRDELHRPGPRRRARYYYKLTAEDAAGNVGPPRTGERDRRRTRAADCARPG